MRKSAFIFIFSFLVLFAGCASLCPDNRTGLQAVPYTGLIVDARGIGLYSTMSPKIVTEGDSRVVYETCDRETAISTGIAGYTQSIREALNKEKSGENPLVVRAIGTDATLKNVIIRSRDAELIAGADKKNEFLKKCAVVIVRDKK